MGNPGGFPFFVGIVFFEKCVSLPREENVQRHSVIDIPIFSQINLNIKAYADIY